MQNCFLHKQECSSIHCHIRVIGWRRVSFTDCHRGVLRDFESSFSWC